MSREENVLLEAEIDPKVKTYWMISGCITLLVSVVGIVLIPFWVILGPFFIDRYIKRMRCAITDRSILLNKGIMVRTEKTVPLDKITDVGLVQGPIMRMFDLYGLGFETAGQTAGMSATLKVTGIVNAKDFRDEVLKMRDQAALGKTGASSAATTTNSEVNSNMDSSEIHGVLKDILATLKEISENTSH